MKLYNLPFWDEIIVDNESFGKIYKVPVVTTFYKKYFTLKIVVLNVGPASGASWKFRWVLGKFICNLKSEKHVLLSVSDGKEQVVHIFRVSGWWCYAKVQGGRNKF